MTTVIGREEWHVDIDCCSIQTAIVKALEVTVADEPSNLIISN